VDPISARIRGGERKPERMGQSERGYTVRYTGHHHEIRIFWFLMLSQEKGKEHKILLCNKKREREREKRLAWRIGH